MTKLLNKQEISQLKNKERQIEIDEGAKLARKIDVLRETAQREETNLMKLREESLRLVRQDIEKLIVEKENLQAQVKVLEDESIRLNSPIDLVEKWDKVKADEVKIKEIIKDLTNREIEVIARESEALTIKHNCFTKEERLKEQQNLANRFLSETQQKYEEAEKVALETKEIQSQANKEIKAKENVLRQKEQELVIMEKDLDIVRQQVDKDKLAIEKEQIHIASQQETLRKTWENIKRLQAKK